MSAHAAKQILLWVDHHPTIYFSNRAGRALFVASEARFIQP